MRPPGVDGICCSDGEDSRAGRSDSVGTSSIAKLSMEVAGSNGARCEGGGFGRGRYLARGVFVRNADVLRTMVHLIMCCSTCQSALTLSVAGVLNIKKILVAKKR